MSRAKEVGTAVGTLACALSIGFAMQSTDSATQRYGVAVVTPPTPKKDVLTDETPIAVRTNSIMAVKDITLTSALSQDDETEDRLDEVVVVKPEITPEPKTRSIEPTGVAEPDCAISAKADPRQAAFVRLSLSANCRADELVTVHHNGMMFTSTTDSDGMLEVTVPALAKSAVFIFAFDDGDGALAHAAVPDMTDYKRVVLQWRGNSGFELHAREFGADYGTEGHVWREAKSSVFEMMKGDGGVMTTLGRQLGSDALLAEVYSFPSDFSGRNGQIDLSVEAIVSQANCGTEIEAQTFEWDGLAQLNSKNVSLSMPDCGALGEYLVLNNILDNLKVASN